MIVAQVSRTGLASSGLNDLTMATQRMIFEYGIEDRMHTGASSGLNGFVKALVRMALAPALMVGPIERPQKWSEYL